MGGSATQLFLFCCYISLYNQELWERQGGDGDRRGLPHGDGHVPPSKPEVSLQLLADMFASELAELGTRQHYRDSVTMFSGHKMVAYSIMSLFFVATPFRHRNSRYRYHFSYFFLSLNLYCGTLSRCRCCKAKKLSRVQFCCSVLNIKAFL